MTRRSWDPTLLAVSLALSVLVGTVVATGGIAPGEWRARLESDGTRLRLELRPALERGSLRTSFHVDPGRLDGFDAGSFERRGAPIELRLARDAGSLVLTGEGGRRPGGALRFDPRPEFVERWLALGFDRPTDAELLHLALDDVRIDDAVALHGLGYRSLDAGDLFRLSAHGISIDRVAEFQAFGDVPGLDDVIRLHAHGVTGEEAREMGRLGLGLETNELLRLHDHGIDADYVGRMVEAGVDGKDINDILRLHGRGIRPEFVAGLRAAGLPDLRINDVLRLHDHGVDVDFVRGMIGAGLAGLGVEDLVRAHAHGVSVDYARSVVESITRRDVDSVILLHDHGVRPDWVRELSEAGYGDLEPRDLTRLHAHGVSPDLVGRLARSGRTNLAADDLIRAQSRGIDALGD